MDRPRWNAGAAASRGSRGLAWGALGQASQPLHRPFPQGPPGPAQWTARTRLLAPLPSGLQTGHFSFALTLKSGKVEDEVCLSRVGEELLPMAFAFVPVPESPLRPCFLSPLIGPKMRISHTGLSFEIMPSLTRKAAPSHLLACPTVAQPQSAIREAHNFPRLHPVLPGSAYCAAGWAASASSPTSVPRGRPGLPAYLHETPAGVSEP